MSSVVLPARKRVWIRVFCFPSTLPPASNAHFQPRSPSGQSRAALPSARPTAGPSAGPSASPSATSPARRPRPLPSAPAGRYRRRGNESSQSARRLPLLRAAVGSGGPESFRPAMLKAKILFVGPCEVRPRRRGRRAGARVGAGRLGTVPCAGSPPGVPCPTAPTRCAPLASA